MRIQHNIPGMNTFRAKSNATKKSAKTLEKLSTGYRINRSADDAAGLSVSEKMRISITGLARAVENSSEGTNLIQIAEGAMGEMHDMIDRMISLAEQSMNGTYADGMDRVQLDKEYQNLLQEIDRIADSTSYGDIKLLDGSNRRLESKISTLLDSSVSAWAADGANPKKAAVDRSEGNLLALNQFANVTDVASKRSQEEVEALQSKAREAGVQTAAAKASAPPVPTGVQTLPAADLNGTITITQDGVYDVSSLSKGAKIEIEVNTNVKLTQTAGGAALQDVSIVCKGQNNLFIDGLIMESEKDINFIDFQGTGNTLNLIGTNRLESKATTVSMSDVNPVKAIIHAGADTELSIFGESGSLKVSTALETHTTNGRDWFFSNGAAIGGDELEAGGNITIYSGKITARTDGTGAAIGGGRLRTCGTVQIMGGDIEVYADAGAGIGSGSNTAESGYERPEYGGKIDILGGTVRAYGESGSGIGGGHSSYVKEINILGGKVYAESNGYGAGIGNNNRNNGTITIAGTASVEAAATRSGYDSGAAIGGGNESSFNSLVIGGSATVKAVSVGRGAAIGNGEIGYNRNDLQSGTIIISENAVVDAENNSYGAAIGDGGSSIISSSYSSYGYGTPAVEVTGGSVTVRSGTSAVGAAIGGGAGCFSGNCWRPSAGSALTVSGGTVTVKSGWIGGGADYHKKNGVIDYADDGTITVTGSGRLNYTDPRGIVRNPHPETGRPNKGTPNTPDNPDYPDPDPDPIPDPDPNPIPDPDSIPGPDYIEDERPRNSGGIILQIGETNAEYNRLHVYIDDMHTSAMGLDKTNILTQDNAAKAMTACRIAKNYVSNARGDMGAYINRLEHNISALKSSHENVVDSESLIRDADVASETLNFTKYNILNQSAQAMLAQANQLPNGVLQLLQQ